MRSFCVIMLSIIALPLCADPGLTFREEDNKRIVQRLEWARDDSALDYLVEIQKDNNGKWTEAVNQITSDNAIELSLSHGEYRYRIIPSDLLGRRLNPPEWARITVLRVFQPELTAFKPDAFYLDNEEASNGYVIELTGVNILDDSKITVKPAQGEALPVKRVQVNGGGRSARLEFDRDALREGIFSIEIENPGELRDTLRNFRVAAGGAGGLPGGPGVFFVSEGYAPFFALPSVFNDYFKSRFFFAGAALRFGWTPLQLWGSSVGIEFAPSYHSLASPVDENEYGEYSRYEISAQFLDLRINALLRYPLSRRLRLNARVGVGVVALTDIHLREEQLSSPSRDAWIFSAGAGASVSIFFFRSFYFDAGLEFLYLFSVDNPSPSYIMPSLMVGFQL